MRSSSLIFTILILILLSCSSDDSSSELQPQNQIPNAFSLLEITNNGTNVDLFPTFTWNASADPDGDTVSYDLYLGLDPDPVTKVASNLDTIAFKSSNKLDWVRQYFWKVVAKDDKGGERTSDVFSFTTRSVKVKRIASASPFAPRHDHAAVVYNEKMWVISGRGNIGFAEDVWSSSNGGETWIRQELPVGSIPPFYGREDHAAVVYNDQIWVVAGTDGIGNPEKEVWRGAETVADWEFMGNASFTGRRAHTSVVFNNMLWVIGGATGSIAPNDVWQSEDGITWNEVIPNGDIFSNRYHHTTTVFDQKLWVIGGFYASPKNDVWQSDDGTNWTEVVSDGDIFKERYSHASVIFENKLWVIGGEGSNGIRNDIWYSENGINWFNATPEDSFTELSGLAAVVFDDKIWILGGYSNSLGPTNQVWTIE